MYIYIYVYIYIYMYIYIYQNKRRFKGAYSRNNLPKIKHQAYVIGFDEYKSKETHWIALDMNGNDATYFDSFGVEYIPKETKTFIANKNIIMNIYRMKVYD